MKTQMIPDHLRKALLSDYVSRPNKIWIAISWQHFRDFYLEWKWAGDPWRSRLLFQFSLNGPWVEAKSYEEDRAILLKSGKEK